MLKETELQELEQALRAASPAPWVTEKSVTWEGDAHFSIRTAEKLPDHPWSARYIAWLCGSLGSDLPGDSRPRRKRCEHCGMASYSGRQVPVDVRQDPETEADANLLAHLRNAAPALLASLREARSLLGEALDALAVFVLPPSNDADLLSRMDAFLHGERSDRERSSPPAPDSSAGPSAMPMKEGTK